MRAGFCAIVGMPNVGKSTLVNRMLGMHVAAVSAKPQTTRNRILAVRHLAAQGDHPQAQIAFVDTPGIQQGPGALRRFMRDEAHAAAADCDVVLMVVDSTDSRGRNPGRLDAEDAKGLADAVRRHPVIIALNKVDRVGKPDLLPLMESWQAFRPDAEIVPISAATGDGVEHLERVIAARLPIGPALFPDDMVTDRADRFLALEIIREQLYHQLGREVPYACAVRIEEWNERAQRKDIAISAMIIVERDSQKPIVVGRGGARIKELGIAAREALTEFLGCKVHLSLFVKVMPDWSQGTERLQELGYGSGGKS